MLCPKAMRCDVRDPKPGDLVKLLRARIGVASNSVALVVRILPTEVVEVLVVGGSHRRRHRVDGTHLYMKKDIKIL